MDNVGDWLYLLIIAIAGISSLFSGKKKKQAQSQPQQNQQEVGFPKSDDDFWGTIEEIDSTAYEPSVVAKPSKKKAKKKTPLLTAESLIPNSIRDRADDFHDDNYAVDAEGLSAESFHLENLEEVRKGIIYAEILNRKY